MAQAVSAAQAVDVDVVVVGAGPAGSAAALGLRARGLSVALLERSRFPRHKICGDFLSPGAVRILRELGCADGAISPCDLRGMRITFERKEIVSDFPPGRTGWSLSRYRLDDALARAARRAGADLIEDLRVESFGAEPDGARLVQGSHPDGTRRAWRARLVVEAGGRHGLIGRRLGWRADDARLTRYALWSHMDGVRGLGERGEMHVFDGGYVGVAALDPAGLANVTMVLTAGAMAGIRGDARGGFLATLARHPELSRRCRDARLVTPVRGLGPLACHASRLAAGAVALVGDAGGFVDPFTGEGVYVALASAGLIADTAGGVLARASHHGASGDDAARSLESALKAYDRGYRDSFGSKFRLSRLLQAVIARPRLAALMTRALASRRDLADRMVSATGDLLPASDVLSASYLGKLLVAGVLG